MKAIFAVTLIIFLVNNVELSYGQLRNCISKLNTRNISNCAEPNGPNGKPIQAYMGPCVEVPCCLLPYCCGIIAGRDSIFVIEYEAAIDLDDGYFDGNLGALAGVDIPLVQITVPPKIGGYKRELCDQTELPQWKGGRYRLEVPFRFVTTALTTVCLEATFVAVIKTLDRKQALCTGVRAVLVNAELVPSLNKTLTKITSNTIDALLNPIDTSQDLLAGVIGRENEDPCLKPCPEP